MLTIHSSSVERTSVWVKTSAELPAASANTHSLQKPAMAADTVNISSQGVQRAQALENQPARNPYADTIVNFIQLQLQKDQAEGASKEALAQRLAAGYEGFLSGFEEAYSQLGGVAALPDEVNEALAQTKQQVGAAVAQLAEDYAIAAPAKLAAPVEPGAQLQQALEQLVKATRTDNLFAAAENGHSALGQSRSLNLQLTTAEGDIIELIAKNTSAAATASSATELHGRAEQSSQWSLSIQGDLNEQELGAISDFINKLDGLADEFYQGDLSQAVSYAQSLGFDDSQISGFSLSLKQVDIRRVETTYGGPQAGSSEVKNPHQNRLQLLGQWLEQLDQLRTTSLNNALPEQWLQQLSVQAMTQWHPAHEKENAFLTGYLTGASRPAESAV